MTPHLRDQRVPVAPPLARTTTAVASPHFLPSSHLRESTNTQDRVLPNRTAVLAEGEVSR